MTNETERIGNFEQKMIDKYGKEEVKDLFINEEEELKE